jgi:hypothetical protein
MDHRRFYGIALGAALAVFTLQRRAAATDNFPPIVEQTWGLALSDLTKAVGGTKGCLLCHSDEGEEAGKTVTTPFGLWIKSQGVVQMDGKALQSALVKNYNSKQDSDGDGVPDYTELKRGTNPNVPDNKKTSSPPPTTQKDAGAGSMVAVGDAAGPVAVSDAGSSSVTEPPPPPPPGSVPPLLQTGCGCFLGQRPTGEGATVPIALALTMLSVARRRRRNVNA